MDQSLQKYISVNPKIHHGKPCFRGTRIPVYVVLELLEAGVDSKKITGKDYYPSLKSDHVRAALRFAADYAKNQEFFPFEKSN